MSDTRVEHPTASPSETMPYRLIGLDSDGCSDIDNLIVFVTKLRTDMTVSDPSICEGGTASVILSDSEKGVSYQLRDDSNDSPVGTPVVGTGKNIVLLSSPVTTTTYNVLATNLSTLCSAELTDKAVVTVVPDPAIMTQPSGDLICSGETHTMSVTATGGIPSLTYQWEESDDNGVSDAWANAVGGTGSATATYTTPALTATRYYRVVISATGAGCGTIISNSVAVTVDRTAPTGTAPAGTSNINACYVDAVTLPAGTPAFDPVATAAGYSDNNGGAVTATLINTQVSGNNCGWIVTYTFKVSDECGNALTGQTIVHSGRDQTPPTGTAPSGSTGVNACYVDAVTLPAGTPVFDAEAAAAGYTDNCGGTVTATLINTQVSGNNCGWIVTYTFKVSDECGNELTDQTIVHSGSDQTAPTGTAPSGSTGVNACYVDAVTLPAGTPAFDPVAAAAGYTDNCGGAVTATLTNTQVTGDDCSWTVTYTFKVSDDCGNELTGQTIVHSGSDQTAPTGTAPEGTTGINACYVDAVTPPAGTPAFDAEAAAGYTDNCGGAVTATLTNTQVTGDDCAWTVTYTFKVSDDCGNELTGQTIVHSGSDQTAPTGTAPEGTTGINACYVDAITPPDGTPAFDAEAAAAGYTDNCGGIVTATLTNTQVTGDDCAWTVTYTFKVSDECGNELIGQTIVHSGSDQTAPTGTAPEGTTGINACYVDAVTLPAGTPAFDPVAAAAGYTDNCGGAVTATLTNT
ncbi:MAG: hypothetical protein KBB30_08865, partial [Bacteroidales bacterium]|nr:hypothetical protein [Bacteroidales bacterium]